LKTKALALFSGGLDSILAVKLLTEQGVDVVGIAFETPFFNADRARTAAAAMDLSLHVMDITPSHLAMLKNPRYGFGRNMNPCIDCHTLMLRHTGELMTEFGADLIATGEVLGQRPMSQGRQSLQIVAKNSGYADVILRPLSARLLPETRPEREGKIQRHRLEAIQGRSRKVQMALAASYGISSYPPPAGGCLLTDPMFSKRLRDLFQRQRDPSVSAIELLKYGRHFLTYREEKIIVGRNNADNLAIQRCRLREDALIVMQDMPGPTTLVPGGGDRETRLLASALCARYAGASSIGKAASSAIGTDR
jgi:tRNA U34 2-thiouridine synthase MnmA/TrmU